MVWSSDELADPIGSYLLTLSLSLFTHRRKNWRFSRSFVDAPVGAAQQSAGNPAPPDSLLDQIDRLAHVNHVGDVLRPQQLRRAVACLPPRGPIRNSSAFRFE